MQPVYNYEYDWEDSRLPMVADSFEIADYGANRTMLVGCYKDDKHLSWILNNHLYNIRIGNRNGSIDSSGTIVAASRLLLYNSKDPSKYKVYNLDVSKQILASNKMMAEKCYPGLKAGREYVLYVLGEELKVRTEYIVIDLKEENVPKLRKGAPFFIRY